MLINIDDKRLNRIKKIAPKHLDGPGKNSARVKWVIDEFLIKLVSQKPKVKDR